MMTGRILMTKMSSLDETNNYLEAIYDKCQYIVKDLGNEQWVDIYNLYFQIVPFLSTEFIYTFDIIENEQLDLIFSKGDKSVYFIITNEIKCYIVWASIELNHYGFTKISHFDNPRLWKWLKE